MRIPVQSRRVSTETVPPHFFQSFVGNRYSKFQAKKSSVVSKVLSRSRNRVETIHPEDENQETRILRMSNLDYLVGVA